MKINGKDVEEFFKRHPHAELFKRDNNDYLISYKLDTGVELAFDPRTKNKASVFIGKLPEHLINSPGFGRLTTYTPDKKPSTALKRVSPQLDVLKEKYKIDIQTIEALSKLVEWHRTA
ncbi:hypothetical protein [Spongorhabdus nitratireducens]